MPEQSFLFLCSQHCYGDFKQDGGTVATHHSRCSSPLHRPHEQPLPPQAGAGRGRQGLLASHLCWEPPPSSAGAAPSPPPPSPDGHHRPVPGHRLGWGEGCGMRDSGCSGGPAGRPHCSGRGWGPAAQPPPPAASPGARQPALAPGIPSPHPLCSWSILPLRRIWGAEGVEEGTANRGGSLPSGLPPTLLLTRMRGK